MSDTTGPVVIVGASAAGLTVAEGLRRAGSEQDIVLVGDEPHAPYDRPPLSKQVLKGIWEPEKTALRPQDALDGLRCDWELGRRATALDRAAKQITLDDGHALSYDKLVVATGVRPRLLPHIAGPRVFTLRTLEDAAALKTHMLPGASIAIVGAGFMGCEVASVASELGLSVTLIDVLEAPMVLQLGTTLAARVARLHREHGVSLLFGTTVEQSLHDDTGVLLSLNDGAQLRVDVALVAIGSLPNTDWLGGNGLDLTNGVLCDEYSMAADDIAAIGDVARWYHPGAGRHVRLEHRMNATEQAMNVAANFSGDPKPFTPIPYFWTDQYDVKIQAYGFVGKGASVEIVTGSVDSDRFAALYRSRDRVVGALTWNMPREARALRQRVIDDMTTQSAGQR